MNKYKFPCFFCNVNVLRLQPNKVMWIEHKGSLELCCVKCYEKNKHRTKGKVLYFGESIPKII